MNDKVETVNPMPLPSRFQIGDDVRGQGVAAVVVAVTFTAGKVHYGLRLRANRDPGPDERADWWLESQCVLPEVPLKVVR